MQFTDAADAIRRAYAGNYATLGPDAVVGGNKRRPDRRGSGGLIERENHLARVRSVLEAEFLPGRPHCYAWALLSSGAADRETAFLRFEPPVMDWLFAKVYAMPQYRYSRPGQTRRGSAVLMAVIHGTWTGQLYRESGKPYIAWLQEQTGIHNSQFSPNRYWGAFLLAAIGRLRVLTGESLAPVEDLLKSMPRYGVAV